MKNTRFNLIIITVFQIYLFSSCAGTFKTVGSMESDKLEVKNIYIISSKESQYIKFKFGSITPFGYIPLEDDLPQTKESIGNTAEIIKQELSKYGIKSKIGSKGDVVDEIDLIVEYNDTWRWDFRKILDRLEIIFISSNGKYEIAKSIFNIYHNKELHNFPTPKKEVPKMIKQLLMKIDQIK